MSDEELESRDTLVTNASAIPAAVVRGDLGTACLVVICGTELGRRVSLAQETLVAGRAADTDLPLDDESVSRRHARIRSTSSGYVVDDLGSTNGTYVNDELVVERVLTDGDRVKIGRSIFKFLQAGNIESAYHEEIFRLTTNDGLTQVINKHTFDAALEREVGRSHRYERYVSLVLFDIDRFKLINDSRGHLAGDAVLRQLAALLSENVRREDTLARVGGEEFALLCPELPRESGLLVAEKLRSIVERGEFAYEGKAIEVTASFGVATSTPDAPLSPSDLYRAADEQLYAAKSAGRNRVL